MVMHFTTCHFLISSDDEKGDHHAFGHRPTVLKDSMAESYQSPAQQTLRPIISQHYHIPTFPILVL